MNSYCVWGVCVCFFKEQAGEYNKAYSALNKVHCSLIIVKRSIPAFLVLWFWSRNTPSSVRHTSCLAKECLPWTHTSRLKVEQAICHKRVKLNKELLVNKLSTICEHCWCENSTHSNLRMSPSHYWPANLSSLLFSKHLHWYSHPPQVLPDTYVTKQMHWNRVP
jgi:hypothetical protein